MEVRKALDDRGDVAVEPIGAGGHQAHARQRHVELFGDEHGERGVRALAHFAPVHRQHDGAVGGDLDPAVQADLARLDRQRIDAAEAVARRHQAPADDQRAGGTEAADEQRAPPHASACRMAARRRG
jgi:hypothetical protein